MEGSDFITAIALLLIFEGIMPFASPEQWKKALRSIAETNASKVRLFGLMSMICGLVMLYSMH
jgi:uncharacterized protein YjeT (DUF2065 family)